MYFMSDACTYKILKFSSLFATWSSGQRNDKNCIYNESVNRNGALVEEVHLLGLQMTNTKLI